MSCKLKLFALLFIPAGALLWVLILGSPKAFAYDYTDYLMDDSVFRNAYTMSATNILNFLQQEGSGLANFTDVYVCGYPSGANFAFYNQHYDCNVAKKDSNGNTYYQTQPQSAALIIAEASQAYGINPQVVLATLQKEQSLVTTPNPTASQLNFAMGYGCPDSGGCSLGGFFNQVDNGTWQFRTDFELSSGNSYWGYSPSSYPCNGATRYYSTGLVAGHNVTFYDDYGTAYANFVLPNASTSTLYCYTPHVFPGSSKEYYSGSYWFDYYFSQWFGSSVAPYTFKGSSSSTIYFYINGYKVAVPAMAIIQDFGVNPQAIHTVDQSTVDAMTTPSVASNSISPTLNYIIKDTDDSDADGGALYLVSVGKRYQFTNMQQFSDFGFTTSNIAYVPYSFIQSIPSGGFLSNYVKSPNGSVFQVSADQKRIIFDYPTFIGLNPSGNATPVSYFDVDQLPSGMPLISQPVLVKYADGQEPFLLTNGNYYGVPTFDALNCWGFTPTLGIPVYQVPDNTYISPITDSADLSCLVKDVSNNTYLLSKNTKFSVPSAYSLAPVPINQDLTNISNQIPSSSSSLLQYIKGSNSSGVWYVNSGLRSVPTYTDFTLLNLSPSKFTVVDDSALSSIPITGIKLGTGSLVKTDSSAAVYVISGDSRYLYASSNDFLAYGNNWPSIATYSQTVLDQEYPSVGSVIPNYLYNQSSNGLYLVDPNGCYVLNSSLQTSYGVNQGTVSANQPYNANLFVNLNLNNCKTGSVYVQQPGQQLVYWIDGGQKHPVTSWSALVNLSQTNNPYIVNLSASTLQAFPTGSSY